MCVCVCMKIVYTTKYNRTELIDEELLIRVLLQNEKSIDVAKIKLENSKNKYDDRSSKRETKMPILNSRISFKKDDATTCECTRVEIAFWEID